LKPNDAEAYRGFADWLMCQGRIDEALAWAKRARELDPLGEGGAQIAWILIMGHRYDEAIREVRTTIEVHPNAAHPKFVLAFALIFNGQADVAISVLEKLVSMTNRSPGPLELLAPAYARAGRRTEAYRLIEEMKERRQKGYFPAGAFINSYLALGDYDQAFYWCEEAYKEQSNILQFVKVQPFFDPVRLLLLFTQTGCAALAILLGFLTLFGVIQFWMILLLAFLNGTLLSFDQPARGALVPVLVHFSSLAKLARHHKKRQRQLLTCGGGVSPD
jgi:tetratricopeptide (TPR) repeat protein